MLRVGSAIDSPQAPGAVRPVIVTPNCSMQMGGEAALAFHFFRVLRARGVNAQLIAHERNRCELETVWPAEQDRIHYAPDSGLQRLLYALGRRLPDRVDRATFAFLAHLILQFHQRRIVQQLVARGLANLVHQPAPVSPAVPSMLHRLGVPVVFGPLNGGMDYPPGFHGRENKLEWAFARLGRRVAGLANWLIPGKRHAAMILVANARTRRALPRGVGTRTPVFELAENGVDLALWERHPVAAAQTDPDGPRFIFFGRLVEWKGVDLLLEAWAAAQAGPLQGIGATLEIIGTGPECESLQQEARRLGVDQSVTFAGWLEQDEAARRLARADALVHPSLMDCGAAVVLEAMAAGLPVIAAAWGGPTDYVTPECGILVEPAGRQRFVAALTGAIARLAADPALRQSMGDAGRRRVARYYDWERKGEQILRVYRRALARAARAETALEDDEEPLSLAAGRGSHE